MTFTTLLKWPATVALAAGLLLTASGFGLRAQDDPPPAKKEKDKKEKKDKDAERKSVTGRVKRMTEAPKGEIDGAELADGTVLHWPPHLADRFTAIVRKGESVEATGRVETNPEGVKVLEVTKVTNLKTDESRVNDDPDPKEKKGKDKKGKDKKGKGKKEKEKDQDADE